MKKFTAVITTTIKLKRVFELIKRERCFPARKLIITVIAPNDASPYATVKIRKCVGKYFAMGRSEGTIVNSQRMRIRLNLDFILDGSFSKVKVGGIRKGGMPSPLAGATWLSVLPLVLRSTFPTSLGYASKTRCPPTIVPTALPSRSNPMKAEFLPFE